MVLLETSLYQVAQRFVGMREVPGNLHNPAIMAMLQLDMEWPTGDEVPWCSAAMNYWAFLLGLPRSKSLMARSWLNVGRVVSANELRVGFDVVIYWRGSKAGRSGHVGLYAGSPSSTTVATLGGNQGDEVSIAPYPVRRVLGYRRLYG